MKVCLVCGQEFGLDVELCPRDGSRLDVVTNDVGAAPEPAGEADLIGESVGGYRIESVLGRGGMGVVYLAVHPLLGKRAAVKVILGDASNDDARRRFLDEARVLSALDSPHIVEVNDLAELPDGRMYLMMEYLEGESLAALVSRRGRLSAAEAAAIMAQALDGLAVAHDRGIVHRDLKPGNLFIAREASATRVKLLDFGIAKLTSMAAIATTKSGAVLGSAAYMSPEQARGGTIDHRADLYAAGIVLYELVAGRLPFPGDSWLECLAMQQHQPPPPLRGSVDGLSEEFEAVVLRALAKSPDDRFASAAAMRDALVTSVGGRAALAPLPAPEVQPPPAAVKPGSPEAATVPLRRGPQVVGKRRRRVRPWWIATAVAGVVAAGAVIWFATPTARVDKPRALGDDAACAGGDQGVCLTLARRYLAGDGVAQDDGRAFALLDKACTAKLAPACTELAILLRDGRAGRRDPLRAISLFEASCDGHDPAACRELGRAYWDGSGVDADKTRAASLFDQACTQGNQDACADLGRAREMGRGTAKDLDKARELYQSACDHESGWGCYRLALLAYYGEGVAKDVTRSALLSQRACELHSEDGCYSWGYALVWGEGVTADVSRGVELMRHACERGVVDSCTNLGKVFEGGTRVTADPVEAAGLYRRACDGDGGLGCGKLGKLYYYGTGVQKDRVRSAELFQKSCDLGAAYGCYSFGYQLARGEGIDTDVKRGLKLMQGACDDNGLADSCAVLASFYAGGVIVARDPAVAAQLYKKACDAGLSSACH